MQIPVNIKHHKNEIHKNHQNKNHKNESHKNHQNKNHNDEYHKKNENLSITKKQKNLLISRSKNIHQSFEFANFFKIRMLTKFRQIDV